MYSKILVLRFTPTEAHRPIVCHLAKDYDLTFNILNATVLPRKEGVMVLELSGESKELFERGVQYLKDQGVDVQTAGQEVQRIEERCVHCGACTAVCLTGALAVDRPEMDVKFDIEKCSVCELCVRTCPSHAMVVRPRTQTFFE